MKMNRKLRLPLLPETRDLHKLHRVVASHFREALLSEEPTAKAARLYLGRRGFSLRDADEMGIGYAAYHKAMDEIDRRFWPLLQYRLTFEIRDRIGRVVAFSARDITGDTSAPKYKNTPRTQIFNKSLCMYGLDRAADEIRSKGFSILVEGQFDVLRMQLNGFHNTVAPLGSSLTEMHAHVLSRYSDEVVILFDNDPRRDLETGKMVVPGQEAAKKGARLLREAGLGARVVSLPYGHDPDSYLLEHSARALRELVER